MITIFTPTYNRAYSLRRLYDSLCKQTSNDFEWLVVDDGSTDDTENLINSFIADGKVDIRYFKQANGGKHRAINFGVREARGELFFIVDSDDQVTPDAVEWIEI
jgi:glycosyltransferase involved in cell wall biosynthesis